ncbi:MAG TPA: class I SAM-dependent methyltransferase [bacterium]|nr:class I SAM-dependent methyltransferase [bacterium]
MLNTLIANPPKFHGDPAWGVGEMDWGTGTEVLRYLSEVLVPGMKTAETGAGKSTVLFAAKGCDHVTVTPSHDEPDRIRAYCEKLGISLDRVVFVNAPSEQALPTLVLSEIDLALIDGSHAFPWPILDFFYLSRVLRKDGLLIVDDIGIWTCGLLAEFLTRSKEWEVVRRFRDANAVVARKAVERFTDEWMRQPFPTAVAWTRRVRRLIRKVVR